MPHNKSFHIYRIYQDRLLLINHIFHCFLDVFHDYTEYFFLPLFKEDDFLIPVKDNSMTPHYKGGDIIAPNFIPPSPKDKPSPYSTSCKECPVSEVSGRSMLFY